MCVVFAVGGWVWTRLHPNFGYRCKRNGLGKIPSEWGTGRVLGGGVWDVGFGVRGFGLRIQASQIGIQVGFVPEV